MKRKPEIETHPFKPGFAHEIEVISLKAVLEMPRSIVTRPHRTEFYAVFWFQKGKATHLVDFNPIPVQADSLLFIGKGRVHMFDKLGEYDGLGILFTDAFFCRNPEDVRFLADSPLFNAFNESPRVSAKGTRKDFAALFSQIQKETEGSGDKHRHLVLKNLLQNLLVSAERLVAESAGDGCGDGVKRPDAGPDGGADDKEYVRRFIKLLERDFRTAKRVSHYAREMGLTEKRLQKAAIRLCGKPPKKWIDDRVLLEAKRLLLFGNASVKEITVDMGFDEPTNFIKYFRKHASETPARFRQRYLG